jgi:hypothetical protein
MPNAACRGLPPEAQRAQGGGQGGIRTRGTLSRTHTFQACAFNRSATCPQKLIAAKAGSALLIAGTAAGSTSKSTARVNHEISMRGHEKLMLVAAARQSAYVERIR